MLRLTRLSPGQRALLQHSPPISTAAAANKSPAAATQARSVTFIPANSDHPRLPSLSGPVTTAKGSIFRRRLSPSTISTAALGGMLAGSWYIWEESRKYKTDQKMQRLERLDPRVVGASREGIHTDYTKYDRWVEEHQHKKKKH